MQEPSHLEAGATSSHPAALKLKRPFSDSRNYRALTDPAGSSFSDQGQILGFCGLVDRP